MKKQNKKEILRIKISRKRDLVFYDDFVEYKDTKLYSNGNRL
jgi:hypothetical protein